ncbi:MAG: DUF2157 domain-containing protein [Synergistaceae bacterium]|jgi:uncharacterized membrane protein|nr:DUF2157 domain-containing protein [Synergistaceae bacterium]
MDRKISASRWQFLTEESSQWVENGFISAVQRDAILGGYSATTHWPLLVLGLGVSMIGLGVLSFIAANWEILSDNLKIAVIVASYLASVGSAYFCEARERKAVSGVLLVLSGFVLLGGLALIAQVFHIEGSVEDLLLTWLLVYFPTFLLVRSLQVYALYETVALVYMNVEYASSAHPFRAKHAFDLSTLVKPYQPFLLMIVLAAMAWWVWKDERHTEKNDLASPLMRFFAGGSTRRIVLSNFFILNWFTWICIINSTGQPPLYYVLGVLVLGTLISVAAWKLDATDLDRQGLWFVWGSGMALSFPAVWYRYYSYSSYGNSLTGPLTASVLLGIYLVYRVTRHRKGSGTAIFLFYLLLGRWYADMFYSFMSKSLFFIAGGVLLLLMVAFAYRWNNRRKDDGKEGQHDHDASPAL